MKPLDHGPQLSWFRNVWRRRTVKIYAHPTDADRVITQGIPFDRDGADVWTDEPKSEYGFYLKTAGKVYE